MTESQASMNEQAKDSRKREDRRKEKGERGAHPSQGNGDHHRMMIQDFKKRFWVSLGLTVPILALSDMIQSWVGVPLEFTGEGGVLFALSTVAFFYGGWPFLTGFYSEVKKKNPGMMTLIALAITVAYVFSSAVVFGFPGQDFFWELITLIDIMLLGHWIEMKSVLGASRALELLVSMLPSEAHRVGLPPGFWTHQPALKAS